MKTISPRRFAKILKKLPSPVAVFDAPRATFEVYRAKDLHAHHWNRSALRALVKICRMSYSRYGNRPPFDEYDDKAVIYLVRAIHQSSLDVRTEEWLSLRMVPGDRRPVGVLEPEIYEHNGKRLDLVMQNKIGAKQFWNHVASSSRMCGIHPYRRSKNGDVVFLRNEKHYFTPVCFALMHKQFILDYPLSRFPYQYITGMMRGDFYRRALSYVSGKRTIRPTLTPAHKFLGLKSNGIKVKRDVYSYEFPLYWFDSEKLLWLVNDLRKRRHKKPLRKLAPDMFTNLPKNIAHPVPIAGIEIKPLEMRELIDKAVPDAPELKITEAKSWYRSMDALLRAAKVRLLPSAKKV